MSERLIQRELIFRMRILEEWRRSERSGNRKILVLIHGLNADSTRRRLVELADSAFRETDVIGWHTAETTLGILLVELGSCDASDALDIVRNKIRNQLLSRLGSPSAGLSVEFHVLPHTFGGDAAEMRNQVFSALWNQERAGEQVFDHVKRVIDVCGSALLLLLLSPVFVLIAICIRVTSPGPAYFRQLRVGFRGQVFALYKFRTMAIGSDDRAHREYVSNFIRGAAQEQRDENGQAVYKMTNDHRVTTFGRFLRRTSLDELPQLWNVLRGEMSMVGPRPSLPYEVERYDLWHLRRVYDLKPGVTGVWQVRGRSRCTFDEMTRMDLQHARARSFALYLRVLIETPRAVIQGHGAH
jgi:lipopolysaccharide/colanic/teichoic acid biosynthesis glycosyltransferase